MRARRLRGAVARLAVVLALLPAIAAADPPGAVSSPQASPPATVQGLTVTPGLPAKPPPEAAVHAFVEAHASPTPVGQLPRWRVPVCARAAGVDPQQGAVIVGRVVDLATRVGAPVADPATCRANLAILVSDQPQTLLDYVKKHLPVLLGYHYPSQLNRIAAVRFPIQAWYATASGGDRGAVVIDDSCCPSPAGVAESRLTSEMRSEFAGVVVVIDAQVLADHDAGLVGDYVALVGLSEANLSRTCGAMASVLDALAKGCAGADAVTAATAGDVSFLKALYATDPTNPDWMQRSSIADAMRRAAAPQETASSAIH